MAGNDFHCDDCHNKGAEEDFLPLHVDEEGELPSKLTCRGCGSTSISSPGKDRPKPEEEEEIPRNKGTEGLPLFSMSFSSFRRG